MGLHKDTLLDLLNAHKETQSTASLVDSLLMSIALSLAAIADELSKPEDEK